ncbi:unnamed protein product [Caenorhabditis sp. 36 PRJEB53466]|nr:unnamed protein product [Caenorhabditis sp. 36 PRJEB53466]
MFCSSSYQCTEPDPSKVRPDRRKLRICTHETADENGWTDNPLIYCDGENCDVAVHQGCYGIQEVPEGEWFCGKCTSAAATVPGRINEATYCCQLCPFDYGALKPTDRGGWAHVICALYIPEIRFGNVHSMEPVILSDVPCDKFNRTCYICNEERPEDAKKGACMSCNKSTCKKSFHVTCAQRKGLLCEEGSVSRNVKYCGYCESHLKKAITDPAIKIIPACPPVQRIAKDQEKKKHLANLLPPPPPKSHMLVDPLPRPEQVNSVFGLGNPTGNNPVPLQERPESVSLPNSGTFVPPPTAFSPPLTTSSRSSVALEQTPPLATKTIISSGPLIPSTVLTSTPESSTSSMANGSSLQLSETTVGNHCLQQLQHIQAGTASAPAPVHTTASTSVLNELNGYPAASQLSSFMHEIPARNTTSVASLLPPGAAEYHLNGSGDEEKTVKAVLTAPLAKAKRMRDSKNDILDKGNKRPRANQRTPAVLGSSSTSSSGTVGKSASMQRLINLVTPVVNETVTDFQRDRVADRTAAERRAAAAQSQPSTSSNGTPSLVNPPPEVYPNSNSSTHSNNVLPATNVSIPGTSTSEPATQNGTNSSSHIPRLNNLPSFMEQLLERQWDQGSGLLMANAHFDVAQLLSCLFQLKSENFRLEETLSNLRKRRDHLYTLNARLAEQQQHQQQNADLPLVPKPEHLKQESLAPTAMVVPGTHQVVGHPVMVNTLFEDVKPAKGTPSNRKSGSIPPATLPAPVAISSAAAPLTTTTASSGALANAALQNNRATPSTAGAPLASTPVMTAVTANEMAMSPDRVANHLQTALSMYRTLPMGFQLQDPTVAAQLSMLSQFPNQMNNALFSRLLTQPQIAAAVNIINNSGLNQPPTSQSLAALPPTSATPNGK